MEQIYRKLTPVRPEPHFESTPETAAESPVPDFLAAFNTAGYAEAEEMLRPCLDIQRWCNEIAAARPFATPGELLSFAELAAPDFTEAEIDGALARHPRIGERPAGAGTEATFSRGEQASVTGLDDVQEQLAAGNRAYEDKHGRVFLIRAAGRSAEEILANLQERLEHTPEEEVPLIAGQLRDIAILRLEGLLSS
ncbi:2-oxo-4-hydroxy-4-carboxy-5-ureidoimidazoline decarboxylase [Arthrobacter sp. zg-ZUI10]|nr:2-oxo-4-hydroxy-4-carboxy-5-ureidoimidazoline decarboxylase [Arthrobacter sunyaminii]